MRYVKGSKRPHITPVILEGGGRGIQGLQMIGALLKSFHVVASRLLDGYFIGGEMTINLFSK